MPLRKTTVLVVDDDMRLQRLMHRIMELEGYRVLTAGDGEAALKAFGDEPPDLVLLDIMMPGMDGYTVCRRIRESFQTPIIMVTAKGQGEEIVQGLEAGADDYVAKPFSSRELVARVKAVLRRSSEWEQQPDSPFRLHGLLIDFARLKVIVDGQEVKLTATEFSLLSYLARNAGRVLIVDQVLEKVWGAEYVGDAHLLHVHIGRLRQKLNDNAQQPRYILTRPGIGYTMTKQAE
jgi:DNA-binding response OmpR family regulator